MQRRWSQGLFHGVPWQQDMCPITMCPEATGTNWNTGGSLWVSRIIFFIMRVWALAWRGCGMSIFRDIQKPSGRGPGQLVLGDSAWADELNQMISRGFLQPQPFYDSMTPWLWPLESINSLNQSCWQDCGFFYKIFKREGHQGFLFTFPT